MKHYGIYETEAYLKQLENPKTPEWEVITQIDSCQAWVVKDTANDIVCLQSYNTIVSMVVGNEIVHLGKWSPTTSHHQSKFYRFV